MITYFDHCPICGSSLVQIADFPLTVGCPTRHYKLCYSMSTSTTSSPSPSAVEVPKAFQDAFADREVLEP